MKQQMEGRTPNNAHPHRVYLSIKCTPTTWIVLELEKMANCSKGSRGGGKNKKVQRSKELLEIPSGSG